jgi:hypothetical protein
MGEGNEFGLAKSFCSYYLQEIFYMPQNITIGLNLFAARLRDMLHGPVSPCNPALRTLHICIYGTREWRFLKQNVNIYYTPILVGP